MKSHDADCSVKRSAIVIFMAGSALLHRRRKEVWDGCKTTGGLGDASPGVQGRSPSRESGERSPPEVEEFLK